MKQLISGSPQRPTGALGLAMNASGDAPGLTAGILLLFCIACDAQTSDSDNSMRADAILQHQLGNNRQLLNTLDSTRRLDPFGNLQITLLAGGGQVQKGHQEKADISIGTVRGNGQYVVNRNLRVGMELALAESASAAPTGTEDFMLSAIASGLQKSWHWDVTAAYQRQQFPYASFTECDGHSLQGIAGYDLVAANRYWHFGPTVGLTVSHLAFDYPDSQDASLDQPSQKLSLTAPELTGGWFAHRVSLDKTLSLTWNLALHEELERHFDGANRYISPAEHYFSGRMNLTYAPTPLSRITLQYQGFIGSDQSGQSLVVGAIYHL